MAEAARKKLTLEVMRKILTSAIKLPKAYRKNKKILPQTSMMFELNVGFDDFPILLQNIEEELGVNIKPKNLDETIEICFKKRMTVEDFIKCFNTHCAG